MRNKLFVFLAILSLIACNNIIKSKKNTEALTYDHIDEPIPPTDTLTDSIIEKTNTKTIGFAQEGYVLINAGDCGACHKPVEKGIAPSYLEIANKYNYSKADIDTMAQRIIKGSAGVWGNIPMPPHSSLSTDDAKKMIDYIFSQKKN